MRVYIHQCHRSSHVSWTHFHNQLVKLYRESLHNLQDPYAEMNKMVHFARQYSNWQHTFSNESHYHLNIQLLRLSNLFLLYQKVKTPQLGCVTLNVTEIKFFSIKKYLVYTVWNVSKGSKKCLASIWCPEDVHNAQKSNMVPLPTSMKEPADTGWASSFFSVWVTVKNSLWTQLPEIHLH